jgi:hypothetical protein
MVCGIGGWLVEWLDWSNQKQFVRQLVGAEDSYGKVLYNLYILYGARRVASVRWRTDRGGGLRQSDRVMGGNMKLGIIGMIGMINMDRMAMNLDSGCAGGGA